MFRATLPLIFFAIVFTMLSILVLDDVLQQKQFSRTSEKISTLFIPKEALKKKRVDSFVTVPLVETKIKKNTEIKDSTSEWYFLELGRVVKTAPSKSSISQKEDIIPFRSFYKPQVSLYASQSFGEFIDQKYSYQELGFITDLKMAPDFSTFANFEARRFDGGILGFSSGIGINKLFSLVNIGGNIFYDLQGNKRASSFHRISVGVEVLSDFLNLYVNGYYPVGKKMVLSKSSTYSYEGGYIASSQQKLYSFGKGVDVELGFRLIKKKCLRIYMGVGSYYFVHEGQKKHIGGKTNLRFQYGPFLSFLFQPSYDLACYWQWVAEASFSIPFGCPRSCQAGCFSRRIIRNPVIPKKCCCNWQWNW